MKRINNQIRVAMIVIGTLVIIAMMCSCTSKRTLVSDTGCCMIVIKGRYTVTYLDRDMNIIDQWLPKDFKAVNAGAEWPEEITTLDDVVNDYMEHCYRIH